MDNRNGLTEIINENGVREYVLDINPINAGECDSIDFVYVEDITELSQDIVSGEAKISGKAERFTDFVNLHLAISAELTVMCAMCNKTLTYPIEFEGVFPVFEKLQNEENDEYIIPVNGIISLSEFARECILFELPYRFFCKEDCKGLCSRCGADLNNGPCGCPAKEPDSRLAKLQDFFKK